MADTKKKTSNDKKLLPFQENMKKSAEAVKKLEAAGYTVAGSPSGVVSVFKHTQTRTLKSGYVIEEYEPVWRGERYVDAANELLKPSKRKKKTVSKNKKK